MLSMWAEMLIYQFIKRKISNNTNCFFWFHVLLLPKIVIYWWYVNDLGQAVEKIGRLTFDFLSLFDLVSKGKGGAASKGKYQRKPLFGRGFQGNVPLKQYVMEKHYTLVLNGPIVGTALPADYPVNFTGGLSSAVPYLNKSASFVFGQTLRCSISLRTTMLLHQGGHLSQHPDPFIKTNVPAIYRVQHNVACKAAYCIFIDQ